VGRWLGAAFVQRLVSPAAWVRLGFVVEAEGAILCFLLYLIPGLPTDLLCYLLRRPTGFPRQRPSTPAGQVGEVEQVLIVRTEMRADGPIVAVLEETLTRWRLFKLRDVRLPDA
jgi:hypothetical protein